VKTLGIEHASLEACVREAQGERVLITRGRRPVAIVVGLADSDDDQLQLGASDKFWQLITTRRKQRTVTRAELERLAGGGDEK
jgi:antitoxin (DNA-binding transcriptional repressor) of toxin-antitoxin stability system